MKSCLEQLEVVFPPHLVREVLRLVEQVEHRRHEAVVRQLPQLQSVVRADVVVVRRRGVANSVVD